MAYKSPTPYIKKTSKRDLRPERTTRINYYFDKFLKLLRSRFRFKEFSYEANYKFFKLAYEVGTCAVYLPQTFGDINKYDSLIVFNYSVNQPSKTKNNLPMSIKPTKEEIDNSGGLLEDREYEIGKEVVLFWTHATNHIADATIIKDIFCNQLVDIDEIEDNVRTSLQTPIIISYKNKSNKGSDNLIEEVTNNNMVGYISDQEIGNIKPFQLSFDADNYISSLESLKTSKIDELLATFGFSNLGRGETQNKERLLTAEIKVESDGTSEALYDYIHSLEEFSKRAEDAFKLIFTPLISINGAFVDLITAHKYYKIKGCGGTSEELGNILNGYNDFSGNSVSFGRSANNFTNEQNNNNFDYGPDNEDRQNTKNWLNNLNLGNYTYIPYTIENGPTYTQSLFGNVWNWLMRGLNIYRINDNHPYIENNNLRGSNNLLLPNIINPPLPSFYRFITYVARRNFNTLDNQYEHLFDVDETQPILKQDIFNNLNNVFGESSKDYQTTIKYYFYLIQSYLKAGLSLSLPTLLISSLMASSYYFHMSSNSIDEVMDNYFNEINRLLPKEEKFSTLFNKNYELANKDYEDNLPLKTGINKIIAIFFHYLFLPFTWAKVGIKTFFYKNFLPSLLNTEWIKAIGKYLVLFVIRNIIYVFSYRVSFGLLDFLSKEGSPIAKHYITTFNAALITGFMADQKDYRTGLKYAVSTTLSHHLQTILYFANKLDRVEKNKLILLLNRWNDNILFLFPKDLIATFIAKILVDNIIDVILSPSEGGIKKASKFVLNVLGKTTKFTYQAFKNIFDRILYKPIKNKIENISFQEGIDLTAEYLGEHFDFMLNFLQDCTLKFYESIKDYLIMNDHPYLYIDKIIKENKFLLESGDNIINQNPIDLAKEKKEIEDEAKPIVKKFVENIIKENQGYDEAAKNTINEIEEDKKEIVIPEEAKLMFKQIQKAKEKYIKFRDMKITFDDITSYIATMEVQLKRLMKGMSSSSYNDKRSELDKFYNQLIKNKYDKYITLEQKKDLIDYIKKLLIRYYERTDDDNPLATLLDKGLV